MRWIVVLLLFLLASQSLADEQAECERLAPKYDAEVEVILWDRTRVDLLTPKYAIEVDWARKWAEAIGQATWYGIVTDRQPAVLLLARPGKDDRHLFRATAVCAKLGYRLFIEPVEPVEE
jgi:hypothetical protein